jgi:ABC-type dipeptide/oligopeptide/nickel transport system ATPase subunit
VYAVDGVSFELARGETLGIVGESGCGKTTAGMAVTQLIPITSGTVTWKGRDMRALSRSGLRKLRREMQLIFQDPYSSLNPRMRVDDILSDPMDVHGMYTGLSGGNGWPFCWTRWGWRRSRAAAFRTNFPAASASGSALPAPWPWIRR